jgi:ribosomal protein S10
MFLVNIKIVSKDKEASKKFYKLILKICKKKQLGIKLNKFNYKNKKSNCKKISILTSPNANKNAQEQFMFKLYSKKNVFFLLQIQKFLIIIKKIKLTVLPEIKFTIDFFFTNKIVKKLIKKKLNPENFKTNQISY